jgi:hypothetical protein
MSQIHIIQHEDRLNNEQLQIFMNQVKSYCNRHGYTYYQNNKCYIDICPYYAKILFVKEYLNNEMGSCDYVLFLDSDCIILDQERKIEDIIEQYHLTEDKHFLCTGDCKSVNTGHFLIRNSKEGRYLMETWINLYEPERWKISSRTNRYVCITPQKTNCEWSGRYYEQGDFILFVVPVFKSMISFDSKMFPDIFWNCDTTSATSRYHIERKIPFVVHLCSILKKYRYGQKYLSLMGVPFQKIKNIFYGESI